MNAKTRLKAGKSHALVKVVPESKYLILLKKQWVREDFE